METLIFWGIIILFILAGLRTDFVEAFALMISSMTSLYCAFWLYDYFLPLSVLIPADYTAYFKPSMLLVLFLLFYALLQMIFKSLCRKYRQQCSNYEIEVFPKPFRMGASSVCNLLTGVTFVTFVFLILSATPLTMSLEHLSVSAIQSKAAGGMKFVNAVVDIASFQAGRNPKKTEHLEDFLSYDALEEQKVMEKLP